eukprot:3818658-Prymnesium_polylepis.2
MVNFRKTHRIYHEVLSHPGGEVENVITKTSGGLARAQCYRPKLGACSGGPEDTPDVPSRLSLRADAMLSDGRAGNDVLGEYTCRKSLKRVQ